MPPGRSSNPMSLKRINREVADLRKEDLGAMALAPTDNLFLWKGTIPGPEGSVYEGGVFNLEVTLPGDYPFTAPRVSFKTKIYHMNISERGDICIDILKHNWSPALSLFKVMLSLSSLLTDPNPKDPLVSAIANQYVSNRKLHDDTARQWTNLYAKPKPTVKAQAKAKASSSSSDATPTTIEIGDSDDEASAKTSRTTRSTANKRKRSAGETLELDSDGEVAEALTTSRRSGGRSGASGSSRRVVPRVTDEVIVIEDD